MDYTTQSLGFRLKKLLRYLKLYGLRRTLAKVRGQYHMKRRFATLPILRGNANGHVGLLGCGNFAFSNIAYYLDKKYGRVMRGCMDVDVHRAASLAQHYGLHYYTDDANRIFEDPEIDLVYIASNHATHAEYAIEAIKCGKAVHIEKPHVVSEEQLVRLCTQIHQSNGRARLGFNRPKSRIGRLIFENLGSQSGPAMLNWFLAGHEIDPDHWYFHEQEGGRILGNLCHWTDFVFQMIAPEDRYPIAITPTRAERSDCDIAVTFTFGDGSIAAITFSAKGHTFEGVREMFCAHRGNVLISMSDFRELEIEIVDQKKKYRPWFRDHGHSGAIERSYQMSKQGNSRGVGSDSTNDPDTTPSESVQYIWETGQLFLKTKEALEARTVITLQKEESAWLQSSQPTSV
jgi:predicted dehydrogenase